MRKTQAKDWISQLVSSAGSTNVWPLSPTFVLSVQLTGTSWSYFRYTCAHLPLARDTAPPGTLSKMDLTPTLPLYLDLQMCYYFDMFVSMAPQTKQISSQARTGCKNICFWLCSPLMA